MNGILNLNKTKEEAAQCLHFCNLEQPNSIDSNFLGYFSSSGS